MLTVEEIKNVTNTKNGNDIKESQLSNDLVYSSLTNLINNGLHIDKNLRQPSFYSWLIYDELKIESFIILCDLLTNQKIPLWLSQRIAWFYTSKYFKTIVSDLSLSNSEVSDSKKSFSREKTVVYLRNSISNILKEWFSEKSNFLNDGIENTIYSLNRSTKQQTSKNIKYYEYGMKNKRRTMEDRVAIYENLDIILKPLPLSENIKLNLNVKDKLNKSNSIYGVFDGHCGMDCSQYVSSHLPFSIIHHPDYNPYPKNNAELNKTINKILIESFKQTNEKFTEKANQESLRSGSTACICLLSTTEEKKDEYASLNVAWCGDTQFCLVKNGKIEYMTEAHKPGSEKEKERIEREGGSVSFVSGDWRVSGSLSVARAFGDIDYQNQGVTCIPDLKSFDLDGSEDYFIIGCDGLWESIDLSQLCRLVYEQKDKGQNIAEYLVKLAKDNGSSDNITAIFVLLKNNLDDITKPVDI